jgi:hypothetical protein
MATATTWEGARPHKPYERLGHVIGRRRSGTNNAWTNMVARCTNPKRPDYRYYGGRGISVCDRWRNSFAAFVEDMGPKPADMSIDRIDNSRGYEPGNCRWATRHEQMQNTRATRLLTKDGETHGLNEWARRLGMTHASLQGRLRRGWSVDRTLAQAKRKEIRRGN